MYRRKGRPRFLRVKSCTMTYITINLFKTTPIFFISFTINTIQYYKTNKKIILVFLIVLYIITRTNNRSLSLARIYSFSLYYIYNKKTKTNFLVFLIYTGTKKQTTAHFVRVSLAASLNQSLTLPLSLIYTIIHNNPSGSFY